MKKATFGLLTASFIAAATTSCGSDVSGTPAAREIDIRSLDVGNYSTDPLDIRSTYSRTTSSGRYLAMGRLSNAVVIGADVDDRFTHGVFAQSLITALHANSVLADVTKPALERNGAMFGYTASASTHELTETFRYDNSGNFSLFGGAAVNPEATTFNVTVIQFPDQKSARNAADQVEAADFDVAPDTNVRVQLSNYPEAKAHWRPGVPSMSATLAHQSYLVNVMIQQPTPEIGGLIEVAQKVLAAQLPLLDQTSALSPREVLRLEYDPSGLMRRTLHPGSSPDPSADEVARSARGYLHYVDDQRRWKQLLDSSGVDQIATSQKGALVFRARDSEAAASLWSGINEMTLGSTDEPAGVPDVTCVENPKPKASNFYSTWDAADRFICTLRYDRYVARVASSQLPDVHQRAAAQYALLAKSQYL